jgi:hypothetical protein
LANVLDDFFDSIQFHDFGLIPFERVVRFVM